MSIPTAVFLDTSVLDAQNYNFSSVALTSLVNISRDKKLPLILPDPTKREIQRHIRKRSADAIHALEAAKRAAPFLAKWRHFPQTKELKGRDWEVERIATKEWEQFLSQFTLINLDYTGVDINDVMNWYDSVEAPFAEGKKRKEFPDALAIAALAAHANKAATYIAVVSADKDFYAACDRFTYLMYFPSLPALLELLLSDDKRLEQVRALVDQADDQLNDAVSDALDGISIYHTERAFNEDVAESEINNVSVFDTRIVALGDHDCTLAFGIEVEFTATLHWIEQEQGYGRRYYEESGLAEEIRRVRSKDISDVYTMNGTAKIRFNDDRTRVEKVVFVDLGEDALVMSETP